MMHQFYARFGNWMGVAFTITATDSIASVLRSHKDAAYEEIDLFF